MPDQLTPSKNPKKTFCTRELMKKMMTATNIIFAVIVIGLGIYKYASGSI